MQMIRQIRASNGSERQFAVEVFELLHFVAKAKRDCLIELITDSAIDVMEGSATAGFSSSNLETSCGISPKQPRSPLTRVPEVAKNYKSSVISQQVPIKILQPETSKLNHIENTANQQDQWITDSEENDDEIINQDDEDFQSDEHIHDRDIDHKPLKPTKNSLASDDDQSQDDQDQYAILDPKKEKQISDLLNDNLDIISKVPLNRKKRRLLLNDLRMIDQPTRKHVKQILKNVLCVEMTKDEKDRQREKREKYHARHAGRQKNRKMQVMAKTQYYDNSGYARPEEYAKYQVYGNQKATEEFMRVKDITNSEYIFYHIEGPSTADMKNSMAKVVNYFNTKSVMGVYCHHSKIDGCSKIAYIEISTDTKGFLLDLKNPSGEVTILAALKVLFENKQLFKIGYNLSQMQEILSESQIGYSIKFRNTRTLDELLFCSKTTLILNLSKTLYRQFGLHLNPEKMKDLCEKTNLSYDEKQALMINAAAIYKFAIDIQIDKLKSIKLPKLQEQLASLPSIRQVNFVLDVTCACAAHVLDNLRLPFDIMPESTYAGKVP